MTLENDILVAVDDISGLQLLARILEQEGYQVRPVEKAQTALEAALAIPPGLILLDVGMPDMDVFALCRRLKQDKRTRQVPIIFVGELQDAATRGQGFEAGGVDFISKPFQETEILARVKTHLHLYRLQQHLEQLVDERTRHMKHTLRALRESDERFRSLIEQSPMPIEILALNGKILQTNPSWHRLWGVDAVDAAEVMEKYNMRTDPQLKKLGIDHMVERAFSGEHVILPAIIYDASETAEDFEIENLQGLKSPWIQCHLYPIKDINGKVVNIINTYVDISNQKIIELELRNAIAKIEQLKNQLEAESDYLQEEIKLEHNFRNIIGQSESLKYVLHRVEQVASTDSPVLIMGETGTGKELIARALHDLSPCGKQALIKVNCATLPGELIESELFGREKGAYTGATRSEAGRFELANGSTLFLDEIGELPLELQAKLLRVLESGRFERLGSSRTRHSDARIIAATNRVLEEEVRQGLFREDLWYRLKVFPITVPPLRDRPEDIPLLVNFFVDQQAKKMGKRANRVNQSTIEKLQRYPWPGNVRELKHAVEGALIAAQGKKLSFDLPHITATSPSDFKSFEEMERDYLLRVLKAHHWKIGGNNSAASTLKMHVNTLRGRMKKLGIKKPKPQ